MKPVCSKILHSYKYFPLSALYKVSGWKLFSYYQQHFLHCMPTKKNKSILKELEKYFTVYDLKKTNF